MMQLETDIPFLERIMAVPILNTGVLVYEDAKVELRTFQPDEVYPTALYVLRPHIETVRLIGDSLYQYGVDIFNLDDVTRVGDITIAPPIVELSDGVPAIVDGIHRFCLARELGRSIQCIYIEGAKIPLISYPVEWSSVVEYDVAPENPLLRRALRLGIEDRSEVLRSYYRDFSSFGSMGRRPRLGQNG